jgi:hypothetical protein
VAASERSLDLGNGKATAVGNASFCDSFLTVLVFIYQPVVPYFRASKFVHKSSAHGI